MTRSLHFRILFVMLAIAAFAIAGLGLLAGFTTRSQFSRYVEVRDNLQNRFFQRAVLTYLDNPVNFTQENLASDEVNYTYIGRSPAYPLEPIILDFRFIFPWLNNETLDPSIQNYNVHPSTFPALIRWVTDVPIQDQSSIYAVIPSLIDWILSSPGIPGVNSDRPKRPRDNYTFQTKDDGAIEVFDGEEHVGIFQIDPSLDVALIPVGDDFVNTVSQQLLMVAGLIGLAAIGLAIVLSRSIIRPIGALTAAARRVQEGNFSQAVPVQGGEEIRELARAFNAMSDTLNQNEALRQNMVSDIAHELRTPLTNIQGYLEAVQDGLLEADTKTIDLLYEEALLLSRLTKDLQELAQAEAGDLRMAFTSVDVPDVIEQVLETYQHQATAKHIQLQAKLSESLPKVVADPQRLEQVLRNLIHNALKYTPDGGEISVSAKAEKQMLEVSVQDTGEGIDEEHLPNVFERFYRVDSSRSRSTGGAGLGLSIVKRLVEAQGGSIRVESTKGQGATIVFTLPIDM